MATTPNHRTYNDLQTSLSYRYSVSRATSLKGITMARVIVGMCGGLLPVMQICVADVTSTDNQAERPKCLGRIMATFGTGFVVGPALAALATDFTPRDKIRAAAVLPLLGLVIITLFFRETKVFSAATTTASTGSTSATRSKGIDDDDGNALFMPSQKPQLTRVVLLLILNGFFLMYAFATETIYAMFMKESFGYGERALSTLFASSGAFIVIFQAFLIKPLINLIGKHATLVLGNLLLAIGMVGIALVREEVPHFALFLLHIIGYSIADTALVSLISRYSSTWSQGQNLSFNQAAQSCAKVFSPLLAGIMYVNK